MKYVCSLLRCAGGRVGVCCVYVGVVKRTVRGVMLVCGCGVGVFVRYAAVGVVDAMGCDHDSWRCHVKPVRSMVAQALKSLFSDG